MRLTPAEEGEAALSAEIEGIKESAEEKLEWIRISINELLEGESGHESFIDDLGKTKETLEDIIDVINEKEVT
tara:strand:+ start:583 stop:801 length:219 start_codon:yes stop_codon:yes gene_type:complete